MGTLFAGGFVLLWLLLIVCIIANAVIMPFAIVSIATSLRGIWRELRRVNGDTAPRAAPVLGSAPRESEAVAAPQSLGHQLLR
jgi:hypothetical protein